MGAWARLTCLKLRGSQFRFETLFTIPEIILLKIEAANTVEHLPMPTQIGNLKWNASPENPTARYRTEEGLVLDIDEIDPLYLGWRQEKPDDFSFQKGSSEMACWLPFLQSLSHCEFQIFDLSCYSNLIDGHNLGRPACRFVQSSWDLMSPELLYPLAITSVGDVAVMGERLGTKWLTLQSEDGMMGVEGYRPVIHSIMVRSIGPILHFYCGRGLPRSSKTTQNPL